MSPAPKKPAVASNWHVYAESQYPLEADALNFVRDQFPSHSPWQAWSNFEFVADDGKLYEIDLMVFSPVGWFLVEIKSWAGILKGDEPTTWRRTIGGGRERSEDNPLFLLNTKAKKLKSLLERRRTPSERSKRLPFLLPLVYLSHESFELQLTERACVSVVTRKNVMDALSNRVAPGIPSQPDRFCNKPGLKLVTKLLEKAGVRPSAAHRKVGEYELKELLREGPGWQDFALENPKQRGGQPRIARVYNLVQQQDAEVRERLRRAADREFRLLDGLQHPGVQRIFDISHQGELGPSLIFERLPDAVTLAAWWRRRGEQPGGLTDELRLDILRQLAEAVQYAHGRQIFHRALSPYSVLIQEGRTGEPRAVIRDWQVGSRRSAGSDAGQSVGSTLAPTLHTADLSEEAARAYLAPEVALEQRPGGPSSDAHGVAQDVFALGAIAFELFAGEPPADSHDGLIRRLHEHQGLSVAAVKDGVPTPVEELVSLSTDPAITSRYETVDDFIAQLNTIEEHLTHPDNVWDGPPGDAPPDSYLGSKGLKVIRRLGSGSNAIALLVKRDGDGPKAPELVLKVAREADAKHNGRIDAESEVLGKLKSPYFVRVHEALDLGGYHAVLMDRAGERSLLDDIRRGALSPDQLQILGADLIAAVAALEEAGLAHRDIKPENIGVGSTGPLRRRQLVVYDFSLSRENPLNIKAGTPGFIDPFLSQRPSPRWDLHAERYAAAVTLYQMATGGAFPTWGDGSLPELLPAEVVTPTLEADLFDPSVRETLAGFFGRAFARDPAQRFDNAVDMASAWTKAFAGTTTDHSVPGAADRAERLAAATFDTAVLDLGLGPSADAAFDRNHVLTVADFLRVTGWWLRRWRGVTAATRKDLVEAYDQLRERLGDPPAADRPAPERPTDAASLTALVGRYFDDHGRKLSPKANVALRTLFGAAVEPDAPWAGQADAAAVAGVTRGRVSQVLNRSVAVWGGMADTAVLQHEVVELLQAAGGVLTARELAERLAGAGGRDATGPSAAAARAMARVAVETEKVSDSPRYLARRSHYRLVIALDESPARLALALGDLADGLLGGLGETDALPGLAAAAGQLREGVNAKLPGVLDAWPLPDDRLVKLAAAASTGAALSARRELYPVGMPAERAVRLAAGSLLGGKQLTPVQLRHRLRSRYPQAEALPDHDYDLDALIRRAGVPWTLTTTTDPDSGELVPCFINNTRGILSLDHPTPTGTRQTTATENGGDRPSDADADQNPPSRRPTAAAPLPDADTADALAFEAKLQDLTRRGGTLYLTVPRKAYLRSLEELQRFNPATLDLEALLVRTLNLDNPDADRDTPGPGGITPRQILAADASGPAGPHWNALCRHIADYVVPTIHQAVRDASNPNPASDNGADASSPRPVLLTNPHWLARYGQTQLIAELRQAVVDRAIFGLWLLLPQDQPAPMLGPGHSLPVIVPAEADRTPMAWIKNQHRHSQP